jgi:hypothetical protein
MASSLLGGEPTTEREVARGSPVHCRGSGIDADHPL